MDFKKNNRLIKEAIDAGCKTMAELALYLKGAPKAIGQVRAA